LGFRVEFMVWDSGVTGVPRVQENATEENAPDSTHAFAPFKKKAPTRFSLRFLDFKNVGPTGSSFFFRIKKTATDRILCVLRKIIGFVSLNPPENGANAF